MTFPSLASRLAQRTQRTLQLSLAHRKRFQTVQIAQFVTSRGPRPCQIQRPRYLHNQPQPRNNERLEREGVPTGLSPDNLHAILAYAKSVWPPPPRLPTTGSWSSSWEHWTYLLTFYWFSPHFLMIPQIDMIVNVLHRIPGETRPILFSNTRAQFVFTLFKSESKEKDLNSRFFLYDLEREGLYEFVGVDGEEDLVTKLDQGDLSPTSLGILREVEKDPEGEDAIRRIMERDETVIPILAEKFLDYTPKPTTPWEENGVASAYLSEDQKAKLEEMARTVSDERQEIREGEEEGMMKEAVKRLELEKGG